MKRIGIVGCGNIAKVHAKVLQQISETEIVSFCDLATDRAQEMSFLYTDGKAGIYRDYSCMLENAGLDCVHICTPHSLHVPMAIAALKKGLSAFIEKPPAINRKEFIELKKVAQDSSARLGFCFQNRYNPTTRYIDEYVRSGRLGSILGARVMVTWRRDADYYSDMWHGKLALEGGGVLMNQSIHTLDLLLRYLGKPLVVDASMKNHHLTGIIEVEDTMEAWLTFSDGRRACFYATTGYAEDAPVILEIAFSNGRISMIGQDLYICENGKPAELLSAGTANCMGKPCWGDSHALCIADFYQCMAQGTDFQNDISGVENTLNTTMKIYEAARKQEVR